MNFNNYNSEFLDPWDHQAQYNLTPQQTPISSSQHKSDMERLRSSLNKLAEDIGEPGMGMGAVVKKPMTMAERYKQAFQTLKNRQEGWRKKEIDQTLKDGTFGEKDYDKDFIRQVAALAESEDPQAA